MIAYPKINGLCLGMSFDNFKEVLSKRGYCSLSLMSEVENYMYFCVNSKYRNKEVMEFITKNDKLELLYIKNWKEFFELNDEMFFKNIVDIIHSYYLKDYKFKVHIWSSSQTLEAYADDWCIMCKSNFRND